MMMMMMMTMMTMMIMVGFLDTKGPLTNFAPWGSQTTMLLMMIVISDDDNDDDTNNDNDDDEDVFFFSKKTFFIGLLQLKPYQSNRRCLKAYVQLNQGTREVGLLAPKIILDGSAIRMQYYWCHSPPRDFYTCPMKAGHAGTTIPISHVLPNFPMWLNALTNNFLVQIKLNWRYS